MLVICFQILIFSLQYLLLCFQKLVLLLNKRPLMLLRLELVHKIGVAASEQLVDVLILLDDEFHLVFRNHDQFRSSLVRHEEIDRR